MKKLIALLLVTLISFSAFSAVAVSGDGVIDSPENVISKKLGTCNSSQYDTIRSAVPNVYGPYNLSIDRTRPGFKGLQMRASISSFDSGDSVQFDYQLISGDKISDTIGSGWTTVDTIVGAVGLAGTYTDISSLVGNSILYRLSTVQDDTVIVQTPVRVYMLENMVASPDTKH